MARRPLAKLIPASRLIWIWLMFSNWYSTGSSMVVMFRVVRSSSFSAA